MGIDNFCKLINPVSPPLSEPDTFDSLLIDGQSFLYVAIEYSLETVETTLFREICKSIWKQLRALLDTFLTSPRASHPLTIVLSFDGEGVPMKWPTQRQRRKSKKTGDKSFYRYMLYGNNRLTLCVQKYVLEKLQFYNHTFTFILAGCNVPGEGEHKIFHVAETLPGCRHPIILSVDQDVFILAFLRLTQFQTLQIYRYKHFYPITRLATLLPYPLRRLVDVSFLFGNDFIPVIIGITANNVALLHEAMTFDPMGDVPAVLATFLNTIKPRIRFQCVEFIDRLLIVCFWITHFWILDYYTRRQFPQQFLENRVYEAFDRNQLLTALMNETYSRNAYYEAKETYDDMKTQPIPHAADHIFTDPDLLTTLKSYWIEPENNLCTVLRLTGSQCRKRKLKKHPATGTETLPKRARNERG